MNAKINTSPLFAPQPMEQTQSNTLFLYLLSFFFSVDSYAFPIAFRWLSHRTDKKHVYSSDDMHYTIFNMDLQRLNWNIAASLLARPPPLHALIPGPCTAQPIWLVSMAFKQRNAPTNPRHQYLRPNRRKGKRRVTRLVVVVVVVFAVCWLPIQVNIWTACFFWILGFCIGRSRVLRRIIMERISPMIGEENGISTTFSYTWHVSTARVLVTNERTGERASKRKAINSLLFLLLLFRDAEKLICVRFAVYFGIMPIASKQNKNPISNRCRRTKKRAKGVERAHVEAEPNAFQLPIFTLSVCARLLAWHVLAFVGDVNTTW